LVFLDANVPMYLVGADHPNKLAALELLSDLAEQGERLISDAEVFQEILHRYVAIRRPEAIQPAFDVLMELIDEVVPIDFATVSAAKELVLANKEVSARDAIHLAVMRRRGVDTILSFDKGFDSFPWVRRLGA
jgi:uncharacterized protein